MGCCISRPAAEAANNDGAQDAPHVAHFDASSRNLNAPNSRHTSAPSSRGSIFGRPSNAAPAGSGTQSASNVRPNQPLIPIPAEQRSTLPNTLASPTTAKSRNRVKPLTDSSGQAWTRARLEKERRDWWDTRVTNNTQVWQCLRAATEALQEGDLATAQTLLDVQGCTCPTGQLWSRVYDDRGAEYKVPEWLAIEPAGIVDEEAVLATEDKANVVTTFDEAELNREFIVRVRFSNQSQDLKTTVRRRDSVASIREKCKALANLGDDHKLILVYSGRVYQDHETLESHDSWGYDNDYVLSCFVSLRESTTT
ncbi:uncharacterized protein M421DRAFT_359529 [Didymella exigua CBS 183.55]|uniref:DC-UbP/UBTD2 N-terminal domain-containing protein n=1 Tax=Didymella exigua CBS 183.55 TaxID=1150837 RepID=A0A6A5RTL9_9PLEO|nr:uncharacterized protein M421DRAFT_359529 [Didymella exigua CBS 183.55]KAF1930793.1 hypothetical protein M421DRAFT_359529 [Didymella exigua CBS 183.55]